MQKYLPFIMYFGNALLLFTHKVQTFDHLSAHWAIKVCVCEVFIYISTTVFEIIFGKDMLISCGCLLLFTNM